MAEIVTKNSAFFAELLSPSAAKWSAGVAFDRSNGLPLDQWSVFQTEAKAIEYLSNAKAYPGQIIAYAEPDVYKEDGITLERAGGMVACVLSQNAEGTELELKQIGVIPAGDDKTIEVSAEGAIMLLGAEDAANGTLPMIDSETGKLVWRTLEDIGAGDGNDNTTYEFSFANEKITITPKHNGVAQAEQELDLSVFMTADEVNTAVEEAIKDLPKQDTTYSVKQGEKVLKLDNTEFSTELSLKYVPAKVVEGETTENAKIQLLGLPDAEGNKQLVSEIDASDFIQDGFLKSVDLVDENPNLTGDKTVGGPFLKFTWNTSSSLVPNETYVPVGELVDVYTAGDGLKLENGKFSLPLHPNSESFLTLESDASDNSKKKLKLSGVQSAIDAALQSAKDYADEKDHDDTTYTISSNGVSITLTPSQGEAQTVAVDAYTKSETDTKIDEKIASVTGGESAADVKLALESYRDAINAEMWGEEAKNWTVTTTEDGKTTVTYTPQYGTESRLDRLEKVGAQANVIEEIKRNGVKIDPVNKSVDISVPTDVKDLTDADQKYITDVRMRAAEEGYTPVLSVNKTGSVAVVDDSAIQATIKSVKDTADGAVKTVSLASGTNNGTLKLTVDGTTTDNIAVKGLGGAAFKAEDYYQVAGDYQPAGSYKTTQSEKSGTLTGAQVIGAWTQNSNGELAIITRDLTPADIGAQPVGDYKTKQTAVADPTATVYNGTTLSYIETLSQDENGVIKATKRSFDLTAYIDQKIGDSTNIMNFRGVVEPTEAGFAADIAVITSPQNGDVVLYGDYEYIYNGTKWEQFGDATGAVATAKKYTDDSIAALRASIHGVDNKTIKLNESNNVYVAEVSTDVLVQGTKELVLSAGNASGYNN